MTTTTPDAVEALHAALSYTSSIDDFSVGAPAEVIKHLNNQGFTIARAEPASAALAASITEAEHWKTRYTQLENKVKVAKRELEKEELYDALSTLEEALTVQEPQK